MKIVTQKINENGMLEDVKPTSEYLCLSDRTALKLLEDRPFGDKTSDFDWLVYGLRWKLYGDDISKETVVEIVEKYLSRGCK